MRRLFVIALLALTGCNEMNDAEWRGVASQAYWKGVATGRNEHLAPNDPGCTIRSLTDSVWVDHGVSGIDGERFTIIRTKWRGGYRPLWDTLAVVALEQRRTH